MRAPTSGCLPGPGVEGFDRDPTSIAGPGDGSPTAAWSAGRVNAAECGYTECLDLLVDHLLGHCAIVLADHAAALRRLIRDDPPPWKGQRLRHIDLDAAIAPVVSGPDVELPPQYAP